ncbi:hypothetical protein DMP23_03540 [Amycolatopsis sp. A1MSW2902]
MALGASHAPNAALGASDAPNAALGRIRRRWVWGERGGVVRGTLRESAAVRVPLTACQLASLRKRGCSRSVKGSLRESNSLKEPFTDRNGSGAGE